MSEFKNGSLFDGSGGFPLAASLCGGTPVWAAEVEPYPIAVTRSRFPEMRHLGDVSKVNGAEIEPVDIITFGSPCQDLSVAGKRAGMKHEANGDEETTRSGLFMEAVRIIKEMREATDGRYPTFALWENVPGAFSSNKGEDFRVVLEELIKIVEPDVQMPLADKNGWPYADIYMGAGWSLAYRTFDAQYWGVPQRRRRIHLVADFRGQRAGAVLFEREGLRGYFAEGGAPWQGSAADDENCIRADDRAGNGVVLYTPVPNILPDDQGGQMINVRTDEKSPTLLTGDRHAVGYAMQGFGDYKDCGVESGLKARDYKDATDLVCCVDCRNMTEYPELYQTLQAKPTGGRSLNFSGAVRVRSIVRRLTPTECARLQGFPDTWGHPDIKDDLTDEEYTFWQEVRNTHAAINGKAVKDYTKAQMLTWYNKLHTDSAEYKMWGNGIALPTALYVMQGIAEALEEEE